MCCLGQPEEFNLYWFYEKLLTPLRTGLWLGRADSSIFSKQETPLTVLLHRIGFGIASVLTNKIPSFYCSDQYIKTV